MGQNQPTARNKQPPPGVVGSNRNAIRNAQVPISNALVGSNRGGGNAPSDETLPSSTNSGSKTSSVEHTHDQRMPSSNNANDAPPLVAPSHDANQPPPPRVMPVIIRYKLPGAVPKGERPPQRSVRLLLDSNDWKPIPMSPSDDNYFTVVYLSPGEHCYKFEVDGEIVLDTTQPVRQAGEVANTVTVAESLLFSSQEDADVVNEAEGWGQQHIEFEETRKHPPIMPPHLRYTPLNTPPTQMRCDVDGTMAPTGAVPLDPEHLPLPLSVTVNHAYFQRREDHIVLGVTKRYRNKFTTVTYYKKA